MHNSVENRYRELSEEMKEKALLNYLWLNYIRSDPPPPPAD